MPNDQYAERFRNDDPMGMKCFHRSTNDLRGCIKGAVGQTALIGNTRRVSNGDPARTNTHGQRRIKRLMDHELPCS